MKLSKKGFTMVELVVVMMILGILALIAFISLDGFTGNSRNSIRLTDLNNIKDALEVYSLKTKTYPDPSKLVNITYSGGTAWAQGTVGDSVIQKLQSSELSKKPVDPLTGNEYTYSIINTKTEYSLGAILEGGNVVYNTIGGIEKTNADSVKSARALIVGNYNGKILRVSTGGTDYILAVPSIINGDITKTDVVTILQNKTLVYNGYTNLPASYANKGYTMTGGFNFTLNNPVVFSGNITNLTKSKTLKQQLVTNLQLVYTGTPIQGQSVINGIISTSDNTDKVELVNIFLANDVGGITTKKTLALSSVPSFDSSTNLYILDNTTLKQIFVNDSNNWYTSTWNSGLNDCVHNAINIDTTTFVPGNLGSLTLTGNTIYKIPNGTYFLNGYTNPNGHITFGGNCIALIGESQNGVIFSGALTAGGFIGQKGLIGSTNINNLILSNISIDGSKSSGNKYGNGINLYSSNNFTLNNIASYNSSTYGIYLGITSNNLLNNISTYNNTYGIYSEQIYKTLFTNTQSYNNTSQGLTIYSGAYNTLDSIKTYSNPNIGLKLAFSSNNYLTNITSYNNNAYNGSSAGISIYYYSNNNYLNNLNVFNNSYAGVLLDVNSSNNTINNLQTYNNFNHGIYLRDSSSSNTFNNVMSYNNFDSLIIYSSSSNNSFNNVYFYDNFDSGIDVYVTSNNKYFGQLRLFANPYGDLSLTNGNDSKLSSGSFISSISWSTGVLNTSTGTMACSFHSQPNLMSYGSFCDTKRSYTTGLTTPVTSYTYGSNILKQAQPVICPEGFTCSGGANLINTGTYNSSKFVGEW